ncbi:MAG TPA: LuxR family transcriptional regulator [Gammaproteobacteria bacterium]|nr:LuxR family transcriptional regulator [Gammaproteobacteria bacterium]
MILSKKDLVVTLEIINQCLQLSSKKDIETIFELLKEHVGITGLLIGHNSSSSQGNFNDSTAIFMGIPQEWQKLYLERQYVNVDPVVKCAFACNSTVRWSDSLVTSNPKPDEFLSLSHDFGLLEGLAYATQSHAINGAATITSISIDRPAVSRQQLIMLQQILPHLNEALARPSPWGQPKLTAKELEVLKWARAGKSYWETGKIMGISERTVKFHLNNVYRKLDVVNRTQAIARAFSLGCLSA